MAQYHVECIQSKLDAEKDPAMIEQLEEELEEALNAMLTTSCELVDLAPDPSDTESITEAPRKKPKKTTLPDSFSTGSLDANKFPKLKQATKIEFELTKGQALFLPAGWFHNVTSFGDDDGSHMALNLWTVPYSDHSDNYWRDCRWNSILDLMER